MRLFLVMIGALLLVNTIPSATVDVRWLDATRAEITWHGGDLYRNDTVYLGSDGGTIVLPTRRPAQDAAYIPVWGDVYVVRGTDGRVAAQTTLGAPWRRWLGIIVR